MLIASSYLPELLGLCDTTWGRVWPAARLAAVRPGLPEWTEEAIMRAAFTGTARITTNSTMHRNFKRLLEKAGPFLGLILVILLSSPCRPKPGRLLPTLFHNFKIILTQTVIVGIGVPSA